MIDYKEIKDGETWELFSRDFFQELGFIVEVSPDRGADGGRDLILRENLEGKLGKYDFRWLVSCKHYARSNKSVSEGDEPNFLERIKKFGAQGFIGCYSTIASAGLGNTLKLLKERGEIKDYVIFDGKLIESKLIKMGVTNLLFRYLPESYKRVKPLHQLVDKYVPLLCDYCGKDLLEEEDLYKTLIGFAEKFGEAGGKKNCQHIYWAHKGECDRSLTAQYQKEGLIEGWQDIGDLSIPVFYLRFIMAIINRIKSGMDEYSEEAYDRLKHFIIAISQKVLREMSDEDRERVKSIAEWGEVL